MVYDFEMRGCVTSVCGGGVLLWQCCVQFYYFTFFVPTFLTNEAGMQQSITISFPLYIPLYIFNHSEILKSQGKEILTIGDFKQIL